MIFINNIIKNILRKVILIDDSKKLIFRNLLIHMQEYLIPIELHQKFWNDELSLEDLNNKKIFHIVQKLDSIICLTEMTLKDNTKSLFVNC